MSSKASTIAKRHKDGSILLSIADDRVCKLNSMGSLTWMILEQSPCSLTSDEVVRQLKQQFEAINAEGELLFEVSNNQLQEDTSLFLQNMTKMRLVRALIDGRERTVYSIAEGVSGTTQASSGTVTSSTVSHDTELRSQAPRRRPLLGQIDQAKTSDPAEGADLLRADGAAKVLKRETFIAFVGLTAAYLWLKIAGFQSLIRRVEGWPTGEPRANADEICRRVIAMLHRAQIYYPRKVRCLQHSAVMTCLLRSQGISAEMVIAAQEFPPKSHAWVEVSGEVVNDSPVVKKTYRVMRRL
jgi:hypothetical protein